jgi:uncharacterized protein (UPF0332 family)
MFDPREFHAFAVRCIEDAPDEAAYRSAISRAYYAAYLTAHQYISAHKLRVIPAKGQRLGPHERTIQAIGAIRYPGSSYVENELANLKRRRLSADYDQEYDEAELDAPGAILDAAMIIAWFDELP